MTDAPPWIARYQLVSAIARRHRGRMYDPNEDRTPHELFMSYSRGWRDGARSLTKRREFLEHPTRPDLRDAYLKGYDVGHAAYGRDLTAYAADVGYDAARGILR